jgi:hypothetical protein
MGQLHYADVQVHVLTIASEQNTFPRATEAAVRDSLEQYTGNRAEAEKAIENAVAHNRVERDGNYLIVRKK